MDSFAPLREQLLRGGIAPRHVKRYLRELSEHLADLTAAQRNAGLGEDDAAMHARAFLNVDGESLCNLHQREDGVLDALRCV